MKKGVNILYLSNFYTDEHLKWYKLPQRMVVVCRSIDLSATLHLNADHTLSGL